MVNKADEVLSKETRKLRKKKILSSEREFNESSPRKEKEISRRVSTRFSSLHLSNPTSYATTLANGDQHEDDASMSIDSPDDDFQDDNDTLLEPPGTPIPHGNNIQSTSSDSDSEDEDSTSEDLVRPLMTTTLYDSVDDYDTDDLLEQLDNLGPLRQKLPTTTRQGNQKKSRKRGGGGGGKKHKSQKRQVPKFIKKPPPRPVFNRERMLSLHQNYPDNYWAFHADNSEMIGDVNSTTPLKVIHEVKDQGPVLGMTLSKCGTFLATYCTLGTIKVWDVMDKLRLVAKLRDDHELQIDEFYCGLFQNQYLLAGGKLKDRHRWSVEDEDCHILPCPIKIFDIAEGKVVCQLEGHEEEVLCIKSVRFERKNYYVSTSQDGYIIKWQMENDWKTLIDATRMTDGMTCMAFSISFLPNTGNKYFMGACDAHLRLYDFENAQLLQTFEGLYTSYCDCGKFIKWLDEDYYFTEELGARPPRPASLAVNQNVESFSSPGDESALVDIDIENDDSASDQEYTSHAFLITRGAEMVDGNMISIPNSCSLHQLVYPKKTGGLFELKEVRRFDHIDYRANSWMVKISTNGRYLFAPTMEGQVFVFNILTGQVTAVLKSHEDVEVRDVILHPFAPLMFSCGDDGVVNVYSYSNLDKYYGDKIDKYIGSGNTETDTDTDGDEDNGKSEDKVRYDDDQGKYDGDSQGGNDSDSQTRYYSGDQDMDDGDSQDRQGNDSKDEDDDTDKANWSPVLGDSLAALPKKKRQH